MNVTIKTETFRIHVFTLDIEHCGNLLVRAIVQDDHGNEYDLTRHCDVMEYLQNEVNRQVNEQIDELRCSNG